MNGRLIHGDCLEEMHKLPNVSIDLVLTSPPYDDMRLYKGSYTFAFESVAIELERVLKPGGHLVWVVADATSKFCETLSSFRQAIFFVERTGLNLLDTMVYYKQNYAPAYPTLRRYANQFEYMFVFSKGHPIVFNPIQRPKARNRDELRAFRQRDGSLKRKLTSGTRDTKDASNVWEYAVGGQQTGHPAVFPDALARDHILSWSNKGDTVLDPFLGSGTTALAAQQLNRRWIGIEREGEYVEIARARLAALPKPSLFGEQPCSTSAKPPTKSSKPPEKKSTPVFGTWSGPPLQS